MPIALTTVARFVPPQSPPSLTRRTNPLVAGVFVLFLAIPLLGSLTRPASQPTSEKRPLTPAPFFPNAKWKAQAFPFMFDAYFNDRIGYRTDLLALRRTGLVEGLGDSVSETVWIGRDGWLFINCVGPTGLPAAQPDADPSARQWADALDERRRWLAARGARYVVMVAPEKSSVYPEHLPAWARRHPPPDNLAKLKPRIPNVALVDPLPALVAAKATTPHLYFHTDSHWTDGGAFVAYAELGRRLEGALPGYRPRSPADFRLAPEAVDNRDLAMALGRPPAACVEEAITFRPRTPPAPQPADDIAAMMERHEDRQKQFSPRVEASPNGVGRAVFLHDSFGIPFLDMMAADFRRLTAVATYGFPTDVIEAERPDVVVQLLVARTIVFVAPTRLATMTP